MYKYDLINEYEISRILQIADKAKRDHVRVQILLTHYPPTVPCLSKLSRDKLF